MSRIIDADALRAKMYHEAFETDSEMQKWDSGCWIRYKLFENCIDEQPTLSPDDVRPVGKWIEVAMRIKCSVCGTDFSDEVTCCSNCYRWPWNYCPSCGAKMEVSEDG